MAAARGTAARLKMRWVPRSSSTSLLVLGVPGYNSEEAGDELHTLLAEVKPSTVLMESFAAECFPVRPESGGVIPYRETLAAAGLQRATELVVHPDFRQGWTSETVAVLTALGVGKPNLSIPGSDSGPVPRLTPLHWQARKSGSATGCMPLRSSGSSRTAPSTSCGTT
jgi:hypothetical protein